MSTSNAPSSSDSSNGEKSKGEGRPSIIKSITTPLNLFALIVLVVEAMFIAGVSGADSAERTVIILSSSGIIVLLIVVATYLAIKHPGVVGGQTERSNSLLNADLYDLGIEVEKMLGCVERPGTSDYSNALEKAKTLAVKLKFREAIKEIENLQILDKKAGYPFAGSQDETNEAIVRIKALLGLIRVLIVKS